MLFPNVLKFANKSPQFLFESVPMFTQPLYKEENNDIKKQTSEIYTKREMLLSSPYLIMLQRLTRQMELKLIVCNEHLYFSSVTILVTSIGEKVRGEEGLA